MVMHSEVHAGGKNFELGTNLDECLIFISPKISDEVLME